LLCHNAREGPRWDMGKDNLTLDFEYDSRSPLLTKKFELMLLPKMPPGMTRTEIRNLATRLALQAAKDLAKYPEPQEPIRCHTCDEEVGPRDRVRVVCCPRCAYEGGSPGSDG